METKNNRKSNYFGLTGVGSLLADFLAPEFKRRGFNPAALFAHLNAVLGKDLAAGITPLKIVGNGKKRVLQLAVGSDALALNLSYREKDILERINLSLGKDRVDAIKIVIKSLTEDDVLR